MKRQQFRHLGRWPAPLPCSLPRAARASPQAKSRAPTRRCRFPKPSPTRRPTTAEAERGAEGAPRAPGSRREALRQEQTRTGQGRRARAAARCTAREGAGAGPDRRCRTRRRPGAAKGAGDHRLRKPSSRSRRPNPPTAPRRSSSPRPSPPPTHAAPAFTVAQADLARRSRIPARGGPGRRRQGQREGAHDARRQRQRDARRGGRSHPRRVFDRAVVRALSQWRFNDGPSGRTVETEVEFKLPLANSSTTRRVRALFFSIFATRSAPISRVFATCVPPQGCRSTPSISSRRTRPTPRGGCTDIVRTRSGLASSSSSVIQTVRTSCASATRRASSRSRCSRSSGSTMSKSRRA